MLAIIPARSGSKGIPDKNIKLLCGKPLIEYTVEQALASQAITQVLVSTDSDEIANIARNAGANVPFTRPTELSQDNSQAIDAYLHACDWMTKITRQKCEAFVALLPTSPLRLVSDIDGAIAQFKENEAHAVLSVAPSSKPISLYHWIDDQNELKPFIPTQTGNRQDEKSNYRLNGSIYVFNTENLRETRQYFSGKSMPYVMPEERSIDIDTAFDWRLAEGLMAARLREQAT